MRLKKWIQNKCAAITASMVGFFTLMPQFAYADAFSNAAEGAATGIQASAAGAAKYLVMIALVIAGILLIIGTQRQKDGLKEQAPLVILGVAFILGAGGIANLIFGWF